MGKVTAPTPSLAKQVTLSYDSVADKQSREAKLDRMDKYLEWLLTPKAERVPRTKREMAKQLGITIQTLNTYDKDPWLIQEHTRRAQAVFRVERFQSVLNTLFEIATDKDHPRNTSAASHILTWMRDHQVASAPKDLSGYTDEQLLEAAAQLVEMTNKK